MIGGEGTTKKTIKNCKTKVQHSQYPEGIFKIYLLIFYRLHFGSLYTNGVHHFISMVVHNVDSYHSCNHTCTQGNDVGLIPPFSRTSLPLISSYMIQSSPILPSLPTPQPRYISFQRGYFMENVIGFDCDVMNITKTDKKKCFSRDDNFFFVIVK